MCASKAIPETGFLRLREVLKLVPICRTKWYAGIKDGSFPKPISIGKRAKAYRAEDIRALIERLGASAAEKQETAGAGG